MPYVGARDPETLDITVSTIDGFDLSTVTSAELAVKSPKSQALTWTWTIANKTAASLVLRHVFSIDGSDARDAGRYTISGWLLVGSSTRRRIKPVTVQFDTYG